MRAAWVPKKDLLFVDSNSFSHMRFIVQDSYSNCCIIWVGNIAKVSFRTVLLLRRIRRRAKKITAIANLISWMKSKNYAVGWFCKFEVFGDCYYGFYVSLYGWRSLFLFVWLRWIEVFGNNEPTLTLWFCHVFFRLMFFLLTFGHREWCLM